VKEDYSGRAAARPSVSSGVALAIGAHAVPPVSGARGGADNSSRVGATSRDEATSAVQPRGEHAAAV
jgi:hypothetical protein